MSSADHVIVAGIATLAPDDPALVPAMRMAERTGADLHLVHVAPGSGAASALGEPGLLRRLEAEVRAITERDRIFCTVATGPCGDVLPRIAAELGADLLVLGRTRRGTTAAAVLGTTAQLVLRSSSIPVLSLGPGAGKSPLTRVLLACDLSHHSAHALTIGSGLASALARPLEPRLQPVYVTVPSYAAAAAGIPDWSFEHADSELAEFLAGLPGLGELKGEVRVGDPAAEILSAAAQWKADLIVMGTHGRRGLPRLLLGSVAEGVVRRADACVLVVPPAAAPRKPAAGPFSRAEAVAADAAAAPGPTPAVRARRRYPASSVPTRSILAATDLSIASDLVLRSAGAIAGATGAVLHVVHALELPLHGTAGAAMGRHALQERIEAARAALDEQVARTVAPEVAIGERTVAVHAAYRAITEAAGEVSAELVMLGAHTHPGSHVGALGSTADRLIRTLGVPCLVVRSELGLPLHRIVVPIDLSDPARAALEIGVRWAGALGARGGELPLPETEVEVLHVVPQLLAVSEPPFEEALVAPGLNRGVDAAVRAAGSPSHVLVREEVRWNDRPADEIVHAAWRERADLLVLATHGHGPVRRALIGATASSVARRAPCAVLLVPPALWRPRGPRGPAASRDGAGATETVLV